MGAGDLPVREDYSKKKKKIKRKIMNFLFSDEAMTVINLVDNFFNF